MAARFLGLVLAGMHGEDGGHQSRVNDLADDKSAFAGDGTCCTTASSTRRRRSLSPLSLACQLENSRIP